MRTITKLRRSVRAISPVISVLLMIAIAVAASLVAYAWMMGYIGGTTNKTQKAILIQSLAKDEVTGNLLVYVQNVGVGAVTVDSVYVEDSLRNDGLAVQLLDGVTEDILVNYPVVLDVPIKVKVVTTDGTFSEITGTVKSEGTAGPTPTPTPEPVPTSFDVSGFPDPVTAGTSGTVTVTVKDQYGGTYTVYTGTVHFTSSDGLADLPDDYTFALGDGGTHQFDVTLNTVGTQSITVTDGSITGSQPDIEVNAGAVTSVDVTPASATVTAGDSQTYTATAHDGYGNSWDVSGSTTWEIMEAGHGGSWASNVYTSAKTGDWTVRGTYSGQSDTATLTVDHASAVSLTIAPDTATITAGQSQTYTAIATDAYGNTWAVSTSASWSIVEAGHGGSWVLNVYTSANAGTWTVRGEYSGVSDTATLIVNPAAPQTITLRPNEHGNSENLDREPEGYWNGWTWVTIHNWEDVDDVSSDGDTTYVYKSGSGDSWVRDTYATENSPVSSDTINSITVYAVCRDAQGNGQGRTVIRTNGVNYQGGSGVSLTSGNWQTLSYTWNNNPNTGTAWTWSQINALEIGVELQESGMSNEIRCTQVYVIVTYTP